LRDLVQSEGAPTLAEIRQAAIAVFDARTADANALGRPGRAWPPQTVVHSHWPNDYARAAADASITTPLTDAVETVNRWITTIDQSD